MSANDHPRSAEEHHVSRSPSVQSTTTTTPGFSSSAATTTTTVGTTTTASPNDRSFVEDNVGHGGGGGGAAAAADVTPATASRRADRAGPAAASAAYGAGDTSISQRGTPSSSRPTPEAHAANDLPAPTTTTSSGGGGPGGGQREMSVGSVPTVVCKTKMDEILQNNFLGTFRVRLGQVNLAALARPINAAGKEVVKASILRDGFHTTGGRVKVLVSRDAVPNDGRGLTQENIAPLLFRVLDGNHRASSLRDIHGDDFVMEVDVYKAFGDSKLESVVAAGLNTIGQAMAVTTTYDNLYQIRFLMKAIMEENKYARPNQVKASELSTAFKEAGINSKSNVQICQWKKVCMSLSDKAFKTLQELSEQKETSKVDQRSITLSGLNYPTVASLQDEPEVQSLYLHIYTRYNKVEKTKLEKKVFPAIAKQAKLAAQFLEQVRTVVPPDRWCGDFEKEVFKYARGEYHSDHFATFIKSHMNERDAEVEELQKGGIELTSEQMAIVRGKPNPKILKFILKDATLKSYHDTWLRNYERVLQYVASERDIPSSDSEDASRSDEVGAAMDEESESEVCSEQGAGDRPASGVQDKRRTQDTNGAPAKKRRGGGALPADTPDDTQIMDTSQSRNVQIHQEPLIAGGPRSRRFDTNAFSRIKDAKLIVVDFTDELFLLNYSEAAWLQLKNMLSALLDALHDLGTIALGVPRPWTDYIGRLLDACRSYSDEVFLQTCPFLVTYDSVAGGNVRRENRKLWRNVHECVIFLHKKGKDFTCNERVVAEDLHGLGQGPLPWAVNAMKKSNLPNGAPDGGPRVVFPPEMCSLLIGRFTTSGDHTIGIGMAATDFLKTAVDKGRSSEAFFLKTDAALSAALQEQADRAFHKAFNHGMFQFRSGAQVIVGPTVHPCGLASNNVPAMVNHIAAKTSVEEGDPKTVEFHVAQAVAKYTEYEFKDNEESGETELYAKKRRSTRGGEKPDLPLFGDLVVYDSAEQARQSLDEDDVALQYLRLVLVASNRQLRGMLDKGSEMCRPTSALYLRVSKFCPMYWVSWRTEEEEADLDIVSDISQSGSREKLLSEMKVTGEKMGGIRVRVARNRAASSRRALYLSPGGRVVGAPCFGKVAQPATATDESSDEDDNTNTNNSREQEGAEAIVEEEEEE